MMEWLRLVFPMAALFSISMAVSYLGTKWAMNRRKAQAPAENAKLRIRATSGVYRSRFLGDSECGWRVAAPLCRDAYVPLRVGEELTIEASSDEGVMMFRTVVVDRDATDHTFTIQRPAQTFVKNRREEERRSDVAGHPAELEGRTANLLNVSPRGACVAADAAVRPGDRVSVSLPWSKETVVGWVLAAEGSERFKRVRIRFDEVVSLPRMLVA